MFKKLFKKKIKFITGGRHIGKEMESAVSLYSKIKKLEDNKEYTLVKNKGFIIITRRTNETRRNNT